MQDMCNSTISKGQSKATLIGLYLCLNGFGVNAQTISGGKVCFTPSEAAQVADSLKVLPLVRAEAAQWHQASGYFQRQAAGTATALQDERHLTAIANERASDYQRKARRRGLLNWLFLAVAGGITALAVTR